MTSPSSQPPRYELREEDLFARDRADLVADGVTEQEIDGHIAAVEEAILRDPLAEPWSVWLDKRVGTRVAVSDATPSEPNALLIVFRVEGELIQLWRVRRRDD